MSNVLVYSGPGVSASALSHTLRTLRTLLPSYDVQCINAQSLALDPWMHSTSLLVIPGGRDLPYIEQLSQSHRLPYTNKSQSSSSTTFSLHARADEKIRKFVEQEGGAFIGICAGAYYASSYCDFERGDPIMQVVGDRTALQFYPGICKGTAYPGFVYESDQGARLVDIELTGSEELEGKHWSTYYNGGGAFIDAEKFQDKGVQVLGRYVSEKDASKAGTSSQQHGLKSGYEGQAAVVYCPRGNGRAILYGNHPEFPLSVQDRPTQNTDAPEALPSDSTSSALQKLEVERLFGFGRHLQLLGLEAQLPSLGSDPSQSQITPDKQRQPLLTPLALITQNDQQAQTILTALQPISVDTSKTNTLEGSPSEGLLLSISDTNDTIHFYEVSSASKLSTLCSTADYTKYLTPVVTSTSDEARAGQSNSEPEMEVDLQKVPKYIVIAPNEGVGLNGLLLPHWNPTEFARTLTISRQIVASHINEAWSISKENPYSPWNSTYQETVLANQYSYTHVVTSTQTMLDKNYKFLNRLPNGFTSFATHQVSGRGRGKNAWISPLGCLQFSTLLHIPAPQKTFWHAGLGAIVFVQYLAGLAIVESVRSGALGEDYSQALGNKIRIKWPNDIYAQVEDNETTTRKGTFVWHDKVYAKMAGVLVNSQFAGSDLALVVGCGINTLNARPTTSLSDLIETYNRKNTNKPLALVSQERFAGAILSTFEKMWNTFLRSGGSFQPFIDAYRRAWLHSDQETLLSDTIPPTRAKIVGITSDHGLLRCVPMEQDGISSFTSFSMDSENELAWGPSNAPGQWIDLQPDGNSFDMLQNLIRKKE